MTKSGDGILKYYFAGSVLVAVLAAGYIWGLISQKKALFPYPQVKNLSQSIKELLRGDVDFFLYKGPLFKAPVKTVDGAALMPGLVLLAASDKGNRDTVVRIIDRSGRVVHEQTVLWPEVWADGEGNFPENRLPASEMYLHGLAMLPDGSFVANFEHLSTFRMDLCGNVLWKRDNLGHHAVFYDPDSNTLWVTAERYITENPTGYPNQEAPLRSWTLENISLDGKALDRINIFDVLRQNNLEGLLHMSSTDNGSTLVSGDTLHLNDVEIFPKSMQSDIFKAGDLMFSLRNINAIFVIDPKTKKIKFLSIGHVLRQHDPDFDGGDLISVFDNRNLEPLLQPDKRSSRIVEINATDGSSRVALRGTGPAQFYTTIMGTHEHLANGNWLVNSSGQGRILEFSPDGKLLWHYANRISETANARVYYAEVLPANMDAEFFRKAVAACKAPGQAAQEIN